ncbi:MAG TPA: serpin family protein [Chthoniobacteraceae bacterium]|nr:serpin family protein [Chthoniobacteraceae bacterium]
MKIKTHFPLLLSAALAFAPPLRAADTDAAATAINSLGIDLLKKTNGPSENTLLSPYSVQNALAMTYAGAAGETRDEMRKVLHFPKESAELDKSFAALDQRLAAIAAQSKNVVDRSKEMGGPAEPITLSVADRLYAQKGYEFRPAFFEEVKKYYGAPVEQADFTTGAESARKEINGWAADQTHDRIRDLIPGGGVNANTRLVLVNAIYLKAAWEYEFQKFVTQPAPFHVKGGDPEQVPTMSAMKQYGYAKGGGFTVVTLPYVGGDLQFVVLLPDEPDGIAALEAKLTPELLAGCAASKPALVHLWMPKFKMEPPTVDLGGELAGMGMQTAFDEPQGSANFDAMSPRTPTNYLFISKVFHKTFISLDEHGTEAAAATAVAMAAGAAPHRETPPKPVEVHVDHPFVFAIQDRKSGACLFLGRVTDPR